MYKKHTKQKESRYIYIAMPIKKTHQIKFFLWTDTFGRD